MRVEMFDGMAEFFVEQINTYCSEKAKQIVSVAHDKSFLYEDSLVIKLSDLQEILNDKLANCFKSEN